MKRYALYTAAALCVFASCSDQMDYSETNTYEKKDIVTEYDYVGGLVATIYRTLDYDYGQNYSGAMLASATDEAEYAITGNTIEDYYNGSWSPTNPMKHVWDNSYQGITYCNLVLDEFQNLKFEDYQLNDDYDKQIHRYENYKWEARWARAYFYFQLVRHYGGVPLVKNYISAEESNKLSRNTSDEVFDFIIAECDAIKDCIIANPAKDLVYVEAPETGRAGQLAVLALKAEAALYKASPLFNPSGDQARWKAAAEAQKAVLDTAAVLGYELANSYEGLWATDNYSNADACKEIILGRRVGDVSTPESYNFPAGIEGGKGGNCPTQNLVEAYENGDKRLSVTIAQNGDTKWPANNKSALETFYNGANAQPLTGGTPTGYYLKKLCHSAIDLQADSKKKTDKHTYTLYRLATFWLNYAEAVFRCTGSAYDAGEFSYTPAEALNKTRNRAGLANIAEGLSADEFWKKYQNERFVELAFEGHRYYDVRRWKEADKLFTQIKELKLTRNDETGEITSVVNTVTRQWDDKMYLAPIDQSDRMKNPNLSQNPGW